MIIPKIPQNPRTCKADLEKLLDELQDKGRKARAPASWFG